ncbi:amino acid ABC transporter permease [Clostridium acetobutylicum]|uniref:Amino acid (Glutamine) ABC transporter, permease component n=1 Tax=Clostridium acetobutylicum (strain ATCC 824 / DSM 792 / JCM 1419 / IAM 19013 / LMG 5710 / NBRC 13948 / NRRL B-527 / VKM B-1787 / 2291 / W) TaxID=272562 RepID=Q97M23_CLOAB|nr:amino acid ABC transporter permease [Clostridium acetobutylicum]AAK78357.1 Amino acid (glutamine) ABC transporter, permease component [Clostridium acetobutylicum ATCC 824]
MDFNTLDKVIPVLLRGTLVTIKLTFMAIIFGCIIALLVAILKVSANKFLNAVGGFYTWIFRGTPLLLQLYVFYYGLPALNINISATQAAILGLSLNSGAYIAEIIRGGIIAIDKGQFEASKALGFPEGPTNEEGYICLKLLEVINPPMGNEFIALIKDTSLVSVITMEELLRKAQLLVSSSGDAVTPYVITGVFYLVLTTVFTFLFSRIEKKLSLY